MKRTLMNKFKIEFKSLSKFDIVWLIICTVAITIISINTNNSLIAIIASIMGIIYVILNGCRLSSAFLFGIVNTLLYGIVSYQNGLYGDFMMNVFYSFPCCIIGLIMWIKVSKNNPTTKILSFTYKERFIFTSLIVFAIFVFGFILNIMKDTQPYLDATTTILSISAYICLIMRKKEMWYLFNFSNILSIIMWTKNYSTSNANIAVLFMYIIYTLNSLLNTYRWEVASKKYLEIDILLYRGNVDYKWIKKILDSRDNIKINIYLYNENQIINDKRVNILKIPDNVKTYGGAYNYILSKAKCKYFMLLDNLDYLDVPLFNENITLELLKNNYDMIKTNKFYVKEEDKTTIKTDLYEGSNLEIENKIMNTLIVPYFFGGRIYNTKFIQRNKIAFNDTDMYNDIYPNILLARNINVNKLLIINVPFYTRMTLRWEPISYKFSDLEEMIKSLININVDEDLLLKRLANAYNYSVNIRGCKSQYFFDTIKDFYNIEDFKKLLKENKVEN